MGFNMKKLLLFISFIIGSPALATETSTDSCTDSKKYELLRNAIRKTRLYEYSYDEKYTFIFQAWNYTCQGDQRAKLVRDFLYNPDTNPYPKAILSPSNDFTTFSAARAIEKVTDECKHGAQPIAVCNQLSEALEETARTLTEDAIRNFSPNNDAVEQLCYEAAEIRKANSSTARRLKGKVAWWQMRLSTRLSYLKYKLLDRWNEGRK
jgi:hypothetical protein